MGRRGYVNISLAMIHRKDEVWYGRCMHFEAGAFKGRTTRVRGARGGAGGRAGGGVHE